MKKIISYLIVAILALSLFACKEKEYTLELTSETGETTVKIGDALPLRATTNFPNAVFVWTSNNEAVAEVVDGMVYPVSVGQTTITVTVEKVGSKSIIITVTEEEIPVVPPKEYTPSELRTLLTNLNNSYKNSLNGAVEIEANFGEELLTSELVWNFTEEKDITSMMYTISGIEDAHVYVKDGFAYMLRNDVKSKSELTTLEATTIINNYGYEAFASVVTEFYNENAFFLSLSFVSREDDVLTYSLDLTTYDGSTFVVAGKDSITIKITLVDEKIVLVETIIVVGTNTNTTKVRFNGTSVQTIEFPQDLNTYPLV